MDPLTKKTNPHPKSVALYSQPAVGTVLMENRWGGNKPLNVMPVEGQAGRYLTPWHLPKEAFALMQATGGRCFIVVTMDLNFEGHPAMSVSLQPYTNISAEEHATQQIAFLKKNANKRGAVIKRPPRKLILPPKA